MQLNNAVDVLWSHFNWKPDFGLQIFVYLSNVIDILLSTTVKWYHTLSVLYLAIIASMYTIYIYIYIYTYTYTYTHTWVLYRFDMVVD